MIVVDSQEATGLPESMTEPEAGSRRRLVVLAAGRVALAVVALATTRILTELLSPDEVGRVTLVYTAMGLFALTLVNPVGMFVNRRLHAWDRQGVLARRLRHYFSYVLCVAAFTAIAVAAGDQLGLRVSGIGLEWLLVLIAGSLVVNTIHQTILPSFNLLGHTAWFVGPTLATALLGLALSFSFVAQFGQEAQWWVLGFLVAQGIVTLLVVPVFFGVTKTVTSPLRERVELRGAVAFALPLAVSVGLWWAQSQGYRFVVERQAGIAELGLFAVGYGVASSVFSLIESILTQHLQPAFYRDASAGGKREQTEAWNRYARVLFPSLLLTLVFVLSLAPYLTKVLLGPEFQSAAQFVVWGAVVEGGRILVAAYALIGHASMNTRSLLPANAAGAAASLALSIWLVPPFGAHGAGIALLAAMALHGIVLAISMRSRLPVVVPVAPLAKGLLAALPIAAVAFAADPIVGRQLSLAEAGLVVALAGFLYLGAQWFLLGTPIPSRGESA